MAEKIIVKGVPASPGRVRGRVKVLRGPADVDKMREGDVLVAAETTPEYTLGILRAAAIVTDHGGILSHPAIVAREIGVPGVVGTGNATELLRDDMEVTVDGDRGWVLT